MRETAARVHAQVLINGRKSNLSYGRSSYVTQVSDGAFGSRVLDRGIPAGGAAPVEQQPWLNAARCTLHHAQPSVQDEEFVGVLTVRETITFAALLRLPASMSRADKEGRVDAVLQELGLVEAQDVKIGACA